MFIGDWLARREILSPNKVALIDAERDFQPITYREWNHSANRTAHWLRALGVAQGDLVAVLSMNCVEYLDLWFACGKLGAIMQTINWRLTAPEMRALLVDATPKVLVYGSDFVTHVQAIRAEDPGIAHWAALNPAAHGTCPPTPAWPSATPAPTPPPRSS